MREYTYNPNLALYSTVVLLLPTVAFYVFSNNAGEVWSELVISFLFLVLAVCAINFGYTLNQTIRLEARSLTVARRVGRSSNILFSTIRRILVRRTADPANLDHLTLTLFCKTETITLDLQHLRKQDDLLRQLEARSREHAFAVVYQQQDGKFVTRRALR